MPTRLRTIRRFLIPATLEGPADRAEETLSVAPCPSTDSLSALHIMGIDKVIGLIAI